MKNLFFAGLITVTSSLSMAAIKNIKTCTGVNERGVIKKIVVQVDDQKPYGKNIIVKTTFGLGRDTTEVTKSGLGYESSPSSQRILIMKDPQMKFYLYETSYGGNFMGAGAQSKEAVLIQTNPSVNNDFFNPMIEFLECVK